MNLLHFTPGTGGFYCGSCIRDVALVAALRRAGHTVCLAPLYLPMVTDEGAAVADTPLFFGGVNVYLQQKSALFRALPSWADRIFDARWLLSRAAKRAGMTRAADLGDITLSMLRGEEGRQKKELAKMIAWLRQQPRPDAIGLSNVLLIGMARRLRQEIGVPVVCTLQGEDSFLDSLPEPYQTQAWDELRARAREIDAFIPVSRYYGEQMRARLQLPPEKMHVVANGISLAGYADAPLTPPSPPALGYLARLHPDKGLHTLIDAFVLLRQSGRHPDLQLRIAGALTPAEQPFVEAQQAKLRAAGLESAAIFSPNLPRIAKIAFLQSLTVFSVPATYGEAFGLYVLEALAAGVPVVLPDHAAFPDLLAATGGGLLCRPNDPQDLADRIAELLQDADRARKCGDAGRQAVRAQFGVDRMAAQVAQVFQLVSAPSKPASGARKSECRPNSA